MDSARICGRKYRMEFMMWMAVLRSSMPMCTCNPKTRLARAMSCMSSTTCVIALVGIDLLRLPVGKGMGAGRRQQHAVLAGQA